MLTAFPRVVVTGLGAVTPVGATAAETRAALLAGRSGIAALEDDWAQELPVRMAGRADVDVPALLSTPEYKRMDRCGHLALIAAREAWAQAGRPAADPERLAVVIGSGYGGLDTTLEQARALDARGPRRVSPHTLTRIMTNAPAAWVSMDVGAKGGARTPVSACASGAEAISQAADMIRAGTADVVIAGGVDSCINGLIISGFAQIRALSTRNGDPESASRPFDRDRDGFVLAEGAAILVLEREDHARARGAEVLGVVAGTAVTSDAVDIVAADPVMQRRVMEKAIAAAGLGAGDIGLVHAHATSTPVGDRLEADAIRAVLGNQVPVTSTKSLTGHLLGGAGALGAVVLIQALKTGDFPGSGNLDQPDDGIDLNLLRKTVAGQGARAGIANAFGFGGHSTALVITES
ncbi:MULTISPECIES: beta-ketoacyl-[acyl-carrier-protein] synthase family protein [unclassified Arthrobacter]|uniref:beta-ketoacyl-[acyl-carrier-protein] synthase family protein n=1 Tax=unclassified Arthrobacter TaxID=235627 RepID=UPI001CFFC462|nr:MULTISPECIES: beta-ketoacyl-[acyl-carrier-protein] synthase family protein [unclassified Arthrobacter]MCB5282058.1 3-oxoacyl-[acyl-carrier-protein] synthase 1 [Arthrobacter sp. ES1]WGZ79616.1 beta-ketoacyl-[acyl-carrier-protein] synthase family protein [Arthrobacter sp. EM1]